MSSYYHYSGGLGLGRDQPHFLDACSLCGQLLGFNSDIFMYRGNTPFCSNECRQEQIEMDEADEKRWKVSSLARSERKSESKKSASDTSKTLPTGTVAVT